MREVSVLSWTRGIHDIHTETKEVQVGGEKNRLCLTEIGRSIAEFLKKHYPFMMDYTYTAVMEDELDKVSEGIVPWKNCVESTYKQLKTCEDNLVACCDPQHTKLSNNRKLIGEHPHTHKPVYIFTGKKGTIVQHGEETDSDTTFSVLSRKRKNSKKNKKDLSITMNDVIDIIPRNFGILDGKATMGLTGKHGAFIKHGTACISIPKEYTLSTLTSDQCLQIIHEQSTKPVTSSVLRNVSSGKNPITIHSGPYGKYIRRGRTIRSLPQGTDYLTITKTACLAILKLPKKRKR